MTAYDHLLVTGGAGFIGSNYVHHVLRERPQTRLTVLDKLTYAGNRDNLRDVMNCLRFVEGDIADANTVLACLKDVDAIVHFAAESHVDRSLLDARPFLRTNVEGTLVLLEAARQCRVGRFLHVSTDEVYGDLAGTTHHSLETDPLRPRSPYAASKAAAEHLVMAYHISHGLDTVITRGSNTYGPYQYPEKIIPLFITNALADKPLPVYGDGSAVRDYLHVEDHCAGIDRVLQHGAAGLAYNLGARLEISGRDVANRVLAALEKPLDLLRFVADRPGHDYRYAVDPARAESLGWQRRWTFEAGLQQTVDWYQTNRDWWEAVRQKAAFRELQQQWYQDRSAAR